MTPANEEPIPSYIRHFGDAIGVDLSILAGLIERRLEKEGLEAERLREEMAEMRRRVNQDAPYSSMMAVTEDWQRRAVNAEREAERLRADLERLAVETMGITAAGAKAYEEAERLRAALFHYGWHRAGCSFTSETECPCGWLQARSSALAGTEAKDA